MKTHSAQDRRSFLATGASLGAALLAAPIVGTAKPALSTGVIPQPERPTAPLTRRTLGTGKHRLDVTALGLGCMGMSYHRGSAPDRKAMIKLIHQAVDKGITLFDTAEVYGPYTNEELVGEALQSVRKQVVVTTKFGFNIQNGEMAGLNGKPDHIRRVIDESLKRLRTDYVDMLYQHRLDPTVPVEEVAGTVKELIQAGKVRHFGLSEVSVETIRKAHAVQPLTAVQSEYSLMWKLPEKGVLATCEELGIGFVPYSPLGRGFLTGMLNDQSTFVTGKDNRAGLPRFTPEAMKANRVLIEALMNFGNPRGLSPTQVALAWLLAQKPWIVPIPGTTKLGHLLENLTAIDLQLTPDDLRELNTAFSTITVEGDRYTGVEQSRVAK